MGDFVINGKLRLTYAIILEKYCFFCLCFSLWRCYEELGEIEMAKSEKNKFKEIM